MVKDRVCCDGKSDQRRNLSMFAGVVNSIRYSYRMEKNIFKHVHKCEKKKLPLDHSEMLQDYTYIVSTTSSFAKFCKASSSNSSFYRIRGFGLHRLVNGRDCSRWLRLPAWEDTYRDPKPQHIVMVLHC